MVDSIFGARLSGDPGADARPRRAGLADLPADRPHPGMARPEGGPMSGRRPCASSGRRPPAARLPATLLVGGAILFVSLLLAVFPAVLRALRPDWRSTTTRCCSRRAPAHPLRHRQFGRDVLSRAISAYRHRPADRDLRHHRPASSSARSSALLVGYSGGIAEASCSAVSSMPSSPFRSSCSSSPSWPCSGRASSTCTSPSASSAGCSTPG